MVFEHRRSLLRNLAKALLKNQQIITTHGRAKEASRFVDQLITTAKKKSLHARRTLISDLGSGSELIVKRLIETVAPKFEDRKGGYTRVIRYKTRPGDGATLAVLEFTTIIEAKKEKKAKKEKAKGKPAEPKKEITKKPEKEKETPKAEPKESAKKEKEAKDTKKEDVKAEAPKKGGFLGALRNFLKGDDNSGKK